MPRIIPIKELKNTGEISELCRESDEPIFVTKNGYGDMVIMSMDTYEKTMQINRIYEKIEQAENEYAEGKTANAVSSLQKMKTKYGL